MTKKEMLHKSFLSGTLPKDLDGFYRGRLDLLIPGNSLESFGGFLLKFWMPWYGKEFHRGNHLGINVVATSLLPLINFRYPNTVISKRVKRRLYAFPFAMKVTKGLHDPIQVLQFSYDLPDNPPPVRRVIDELVCVGKDKYLGKGFLKDKNKYRLAAFFTLESV